MHAQGAGAQLDAVTEVDRVNARFAVQHGMDFVALSFVRTVDDVLAGGAAIEDAGGALPMIAKIETAVALDSLDEIIGAADAAMVARGDLGVEVGAAEVPVLQRTIIEAAGQSLAPVIIATQMLEAWRARPTDPRRGQRRGQRRLGWRRRLDALSRDRGRPLAGRDGRDDGRNHPYRGGQRPRALGRAGS